MSAVAAGSPWGPPWFRSLVSRNGLMHTLARGSGTQTLGVPSAPVGIPSAPGNVPKYESNERFSCMMTITCLILWMPSSAWPGAALEAVRPRTRAATAAVIQAGLRIRHISLSDHLLVHLRPEAVVRFA